MELVTDAIEAITPAGVRVAGGREIEVDAIVLGTGFAASEFLAPMDDPRAAAAAASTRPGRTARRHGWASRCPAFPNFFMIYGPNTNLGHNSIVFMLECQVAHVMRCLRKLREARGADHRGDAAAVRALQRARCSSARSGRCSPAARTGTSTRNGRHTVNWPGFTTTYRWLTRHAGLGGLRASSWRVGLSGRRARGVAGCVAITVARRRSDRWPGAVWDLPGRRT